MKRQYEVTRTTKETDVSVTINLDGTGVSDIDCSPTFMQHMLTTLAVHSGFDITIKASGDLQHHIVEDVALCLGMAIRGCIDDIAMIDRYGNATVPMDCSLALVAIDISNRPFSVVDLSSGSDRIEDTQIEDIVHFFYSLSTSLAAAVHAKILYGENEHHKIEAVFKGLGIALKSATRIRATNSAPASSKGVL